MYRKNISIVRGGPAPEAQLPAIKEAGWDGVFFTWTGGAADGALADRIAETGLTLQSVHAPYDRADALWGSSAAGAAEAERQIACIRDARSWGCSLVVMHAIVGMERIAPNAADRARGLANFGKIFDAAARSGVIVAMENTEGEAYLDTLLTAFRGHPAVRFCIDTGHEMCYDHCHDLIGKYADLLCCTHLNDNLGMRGEKITWLDDLHLLPFDGVCDWVKVAARLKAADYRGDLTFEVKLEGREGRHEHDAYRAMPFAEYAALAFARAKRLEEMLLNDHENRKHER